MTEVLLYRKLYENIKGDILSGKYREGDMLPSENVLKDAWHVTRSTVRRAMLELEKQGYIARKQGKGSIVLPRGRHTLGLLSVKGFSQVVGETKKPVKTITIEKPIQTFFPADFFYSLSDVEIKAGCIFLKRIRCVGDEPVMLESTYIPNIGLDNLVSMPFVNGSLFETLGRVYKIEIRHVEPDLRAVLASRAESRWLRIPEGTPLLHIYLRFSTNRQHVSIYSSLLCNTNRYSVGINH